MQQLEQAPSPAFTPSDDLEVGQRLTRDVTPPEASLAIPFLLALVEQSSRTAKGDGRGAPVTFPRPPHSVRA
jgi:hypothetical protein